MTREMWEEHARWWVDGFTDGVDPEYTEQIIPMATAELAGAERVLDVGCGEGQIARVAVEGGSHVVGVDPTWGCLEVAARRGGGPAYARAAAASLPFADRSFDAVVACLVFEHIDDVDAAIAEVARVTEVGGRFCLFLNHPILQAPGSVWVDDHLVDPPEQYWRLGPYLDEVETVEEVELGVHVRFLHRPLSRYVNALAANGLAIEHMAEPAPPPGFLARAPGYAASAAFPRLLLLRSRRTA
ncbi:class I SAM-dependent methyltransferase [Ilumatobacter sp.]|uniref:class I SAM-dependent methyltransferase n=1 Tax=Ilumatobacter sp. TaxID=1967498 RepID=UPI003B51C55C